MENAQLNQKPHEHKTLLIMLVCLMVTFVLLGIVLVSKKTKQDKDKSMAVTSKNKPTRPSEAPTPTPTLIPYAKKGVMKLVTANNVLRFPVGQDIKIGVLASSEKSDIVGFDIVLAYDSGILEYTSTTSTLSAFKAYSYPRTDYVSITMIKSLQETSATIFDNTDIAQLSFKALKQGTTSVELTAKGNDSTKFADTNAEVTYPEVNKLTIEIY